MPMEWFKVRHGVVANPCWLTVAKESRTSTPVVVAVWIALMTYASQSEDRGRIPDYAAREIDLLYRLKTGTAANIMIAMEQRGLIVGGAIVDWEETQIAGRQAEGKDAARQGKTSAERARAYRDRKRQQTIGVTERHGASRDGVTGDLLDQDQDKDKDQDTETDSLSPQTPPRVTSRDECDGDCDGTVTPSQPGTDWSEEYPIPEHCPEHAALDDCPFARGPQQSAPQPAPRKPKVDLREQDWEAWYAAYPKHVGKAQAWKTWQAAVKSGELPPLEDLLTALKWQKPNWERNDPKYTPHPATYLNAHRWEDEPQRESCGTSWGSRMSPPIESCWNDPNIKSGTFTPEEVGAMVAAMR